MVVVGGTTYRIERTAPSCYAVVRLLDDTLVGTFRTVPTVRVESAKIEIPVLREVVRAALRSARTSSVMHAVPMPRTPVVDESSGVEGAVAAAAPVGEAATKSEADESGAVSVVRGGSKSSQPPPHSALA
jgi:hypothetical protein